MLRYSRLCSFAVILIAGFSGCKKDKSPKILPIPQIDIIAGVYTGWYHTSGSYKPTGDSVLSEIVVQRTGDETFEVVNERREYAYPKSFVYSNFEYKFLSQGPMSAFHHHIVFDPSNRRITLSITYEDIYGERSYDRFSGEK